MILMFLVKQMKSLGHLLTGKYLVKSLKENQNVKQHLEQKMP